MNYLKILSAQLPDVSEAIRERINSGSWYLLKNRSGGLFKLKTDDRLYGLSESGKIVEILERDEGGEDFDFYYFADAPRPGSLGNLKIGERF